MIYVGEEFSYVAFQNPRCARVVARNGACVIAKAVERAVRSFGATAGIRIEYEFWVEIRIQDAINGMVEQSVAHGRFVDVARFGIVDPERRITAVPVGLVGQFAIKRENVVHESGRKLLDIFAAALVFQKFAPCREQIVDGNDIMIDMTRPHFPLSLSLSR